MIKSLKKTHKPSGMSLLLTMIILASVFAGIVGIAVLIIRELQLSRNVNHSIYAYYAAESGVERGLYDILDQRRLGNNLVGTITALTDNSGEFDQVLSTSGNGASWDTSQAEKKPFDMEVSVLNRDQSVQFSLFDPDDFSEPEISVPLGVSELLFDWQENDPLSEVEVTVFEINTDSGKTCEKLKKARFDFAPDDYWLLDVDQITLDPYCSDADKDVFQIRIKALHDKIYNLELIPYSFGHSDELTGDDGITSGIWLKSVGQFSKTKQAILMQIPWNLAASGFLDYVIFSEEPFEKWL